MVYSVLLVEDNEGDVVLVQTMLGQHLSAGHRFVVRVAKTLAEGVNLMHECDVILLDLSLPDSIGLDTFTSFWAAACRLNTVRPVIVVTGISDEEAGRLAIAYGAQDFLFKGRFSGETLARSIMYSVERQRRQSAEFILQEMVKMMAGVRGEIATLRAGISEVTEALRAPSD